VSAKAAPGGRAAAATRARHERNSQAIRRIKQALDVTQKEMAAIRGNLGTGGGDLRKDVAKLLRDARRDVEKMNKAVLGDLERLRKELAAAAKARPVKRTSSSSRKPRRASASARGRRRTA